MITPRFCTLICLTALFAAPTLAQAVSKDAQELMALREKRAPLECQMTKLYSQVRAAQKAGDQAKVETLVKQMHEVDDKLRADRPKLDQLMQRVRNTPDHKLILEQQVKFDKACK
jgi:mevalonate kinase